MVNVSVFDVVVFGCYLTGLCGFTYRPDVSEHSSDAIHNSTRCDAKPFCVDWLRTYQQSEELCVSLTDVSGVCLFFVLGLH